MFLKIEQVENWIITTMSIIYRNVPTSKYQYFFSQCIQMENMLIVFYTMFGLSMCHLYALSVLSIYLSVHSYSLWTLSLLSNFLPVLFLET